MAKSLLLLASALAVAAGGLPPETFDKTSVGSPASNAPAELYPVSAGGPSPAMVLLHSCDGVSSHSREWARRLASWGYVTLLVDSFRPRGVQNICNHGMLIPPTLQAADGFAAADYLRSLPTVRPDRIGVIGFSHGGWAVLKAVQVDAPGREPAFAAAVAFYPGCDPARSPLVTDTLILIGGADEWTPASRCMRWRDLVEMNGHEVDITVFPNALHSFDAARPPHWYAGHWIGRDPAAAPYAIEETHRFLDDHLMK